MNLELLAALIAAAREKSETEAEEKTAAVDAMLARKGYRDPAELKRRLRLQERLRQDDARRQSAKDLAFAVDRTITVTDTQHITAHYNPSTLVVDHETGEFVRVSGDIDIVVHKPGQAVSVIGRKVIKGMLQDLLERGLIDG